MRMYPILIHIHYMYIYIPVYTYMYMYIYIYPLNSTDTVHVHYMYIYNIVLHVVSQTSHIMTTDDRLYTTLRSDHHQYCFMLSLLVSLLLLLLNIIQYYTISDIYISSPYIVYSIHYNSIHLSSGQWD